MTSRPAALLLLALVLAGCGDDGGGGSAGAPPAALPEDLCTVLEPLVPPDLGLGDPVAAGGEQPGARTATCSMSGPGGRRLSVEVTSYALADADDPVELRVAHLAACNELLTRDGLADTRQEELDCDATLPDGSFVSLDQLLASQAVLRLELAVPDRLPAQVAAYGTALAGELRDL